MNLKVQVTTGRPVYVAGSAYFRNCIALLNKDSRRYSILGSVRINGFRAVGVFDFNKTAVAAIPACRIADVGNQAVGRRVDRRTAGVRDINRVLRVQFAPVPAVLLRRKRKVTAKTGKRSAAVRSLALGL